MASTLTRPGSAPCCSSKQELDKQELSEKIKYPLSRHDVLQSQDTKSSSSSSCTAALRNLHNQAELNSKNHGLQIFDPGNGLSQPRYVVSPTYQNGLIHANMQPTFNPCQQLSGNQWNGVQNYANLYLTRSSCDPNAQHLNPEENLRPVLPPKKLTSYGKISRNATASNSRMSSDIVQDEIDLGIFKEDKTILQVPRKMVIGQSSRNRAPLKVEEANELSSSFKSDEEGIQPRASGHQIMNKSSRSVGDNNTRTFHRVDTHQNDGLDIKSFCRVLKYLMVLLVGFIVGAGVHALVKCWTKESSKK